MREFLEKAKALVVSREEACRTMSTDELQVGDVDVCMKEIQEHCGTGENGVEVLKKM